MTDESIAARRALRSSGGDPEDASARDADTVERYVQ